MVVQTCFFDINCVLVWLVTTTALHIIIGIPYIGKKEGMELGTTYAYIRIPTKEQHENRQKIAILKYGVSPERIILDRQSGKDFDRPGYRALVERLQPEDTLVIKSIDRLGRNYSDILEQWRIITKEKQAAVVVLDMPLLCSRNDRNDLTDTLIADIVLQLLSYVAETERTFIRQRQAEGIAAARARGQRFGRPKMQRPAEFEALKVRYEEGDISARKAAKILGISHASFLKWIKN